MNRWILILLAVLLLLGPSTMMADECMEGDCDNGFGTGFTENNKVYEGEWQDGMPHGQGKLYVSKGVVVVGEWEKGELVKQNDADKDKKGDIKEE